MGLPPGRQAPDKALEYQQLKNAIVGLRSEQVEQGEATVLFGQERSHSLEGTLGTIGNLD